MEHHSAWNAESLKQSKNSLSLMEPQGHRVQKTQPLTTPGVKHANFLLSRAVRANNQDGGSPLVGWPKPLN
jgi:hypothetical protein